MIHFVIIIVSYLVLIRLLFVELRFRQIKIKSILYYYYIIILYKRNGVSLSCSLKSTGTLIFANFHFYSSVIAF